MRQHYIIPQKTTEPHSLWQNESEFVIGQHKKWSRRIKQKFKVPDKMWCRLSVYVAALQRLVVRKSDMISGVEQVTHRKPDISDYVTFHFYETVKYHDVDFFPANTEHFGK